MKSKIEFISLLFLFMTHLTGIQPVLAEEGTTLFEYPEVRELWMRAAPPNANMLAAYITVENNSQNPMKLTGAFAPDFGMAEIHKTVEIDGMLKMREQKEMAISAQSSLVMEPGGLHIMLMMPKKKFKVGDQTRICLVYQDTAGQEYVQHLDFPVLRK